MALDGLRPEFQISPEPIRETATDHARYFTHILRPLRPGIVCIPAVVIQTFHPDSGEYRTLRSEPISITVEPDPEDASRIVLPRIQSQPPLRLNGIRHNRVNEETMMLVRDTLEVLGRYWWVFVPLAPLLWFALRPLTRRRERCRRDPVYARAVAAWRRFRQAVGRDEETAWRNYLADRLSLCAEALTTVNGANDFRSLALVDISPPLATHLGRRKSLGHFTDRQTVGSSRDCTDHGHRHRQAVVGDRLLTQTVNVEWKKGTGSEPRQMPDVRETRDSHLFLLKEPTFSLS